MSKMNKDKIAKLLDQLDRHPDDVNLIELIQAFVPNSLTITVSPHDNILGVYNGRVINMKIKRTDKRKMKMLKRLMNTKKEGGENYQEVIDNFLLIVDGVIWNLAKKGRSQKKK